jgi:hypothetical protein
MRLDFLYKAISETWTYISHMAHSQGFLLSLKPEGMRAAENYYICGLFYPILAAHRILKTPLHESK